MGGIWLPPVTDLREQLQSTLGIHYSIERELGGGGMSRVFVARDEALGRDVVVKVIAPESAEGMSGERFAREVRLAARLQQANIVPVLSAGTTGQLPFYIMPYVRGESLRARLSAGAPVGATESVSILRDLARALAYAHADGIVHRDIKPENILLSGGAAVVTDFGIAKAIDASRTHAEGNATGITRAGMALGTPAYMAPEQALGDPSADARADIYSWGVVAWELLGGAHPFAGRSTIQSLIAAHVTEIPPSLASKVPTLSPRLAALVMRCLAKEPSKRPASAMELVTTLDSVSTSDENQAVPRTPMNRRRFVFSGAAVLALVALIATGLALKGSTRVADAATRKSLAILPFVSAGKDTADSYLGEGIAEEVSNTLAQIPSVRLAGRSSAARIARTVGLSIPEMAKRLDVSTVLDGTVRRAGDHIRVTVELTNGADGTVLWHQSYDRLANDLVSMQGDIARAIAGQLQVTLSARVGAGGTRDAAAQDLYLRGMYLFRRRGPSLIEAISNFEEATALDSNFARAWAGLSWALTVEGNYLDVPLGSVISRARAAAERAVRIDSMLSEAHLALGYVEAESFQWEAAEKELRRAVALDSTSPEPRYRLGYLLVNMHRPAEAIPVLRQGKALDPMYFLISGYLGGAELQTGEITAGVAEEQRALALEPQNVAALSSMAHGYTMAGMRDSAVAVARRMQGVTNAPGRLGIAAFVLARNGERREAESIIRKLEALPPGTWTRSSGLAIAYLGIGDTARAETYMERAASGDGDLFILLSSFVDVRMPRDARADAVVRRFHLDPEKWSHR
jgi:eukaryotic-like serine/threonine-protein kinase